MGSYHLTQHGDAAYDALWTGFGFMLFSTIVFMGMTLLNTNTKRAPFFYLTTSITTIAAAAYLVMALGGSAITIGTEGREFLWVRYADWAFTTPLLLLDLGLLAGATLPEIGFVVIMDLIMIATGFAGAVSSGHHATWPLFVFGLVAFIPVLNFLARTLPERAAQAGPAVAATYRSLSFITVALWSLYPIVWATSEGSAKDSYTYYMKPDQEVICYTVLDICAKCVFGFILLSAHNAMDAAPGVVVLVAAKEEAAPAKAAPETVAAAEVAV
jgi:bacteriorhodopsin